VRSRSDDNNGRAVTLNFILLKGSDGWVISDVQSPHDSLPLFLAQFKHQGDGPVRERQQPFTVCDK
jgi:hypothetical protein